MEGIFFGGLPKNKGKFERKKERKNRPSFGRLHIIPHTTCVGGGWGGGVGEGKVGQKKGGGERVFVHFSDTPEFSNLWLENTSVLWRPGGKIFLRPSFFFLTHGVCEKLGCVRQRSVA